MTNAHDDFAAMLNAGSASNYRRGFDPGEKVDAYVISTKGNFLILDVKAKNEGIVPISEITQDDGSMSVNPGDSIKVTFVGVQNGAFIFTTKNKTVAVGDSTIANAFATQMPIDGIVKAEQNGGYEITVAGQRAFCPFSQINLFRKDGEEYVGKKFTFLITTYEADERGMNIIASRRAFLEAERAKQKADLFATLEEGQIIKGKVTRLMDFGVFVDLGGAEGLVPMRELSWQRGVKAEDICKTDDEVEVMVNAFDPETERISLSIKNLVPNPWTQFLAKYNVGDVLFAKIVRIEKFGAFAELIPGVDGLLSNGRLAQGKRISSPREVVNEGDSVEVQIETIDTEKNQVALKLMDRRFEQLNPDGINVGAEVEGIIESLQAFGAFVRLTEEKTGLLHISETGLPKNGSPLQQLEHAYPVDSKVKVVVKEISDKRIALTTPAKWAEAKAIEADGDPMDWVKQSNANNRASFNSFGSALDGLKF